MSLKDGIKVIYFDLDNTLWDFDKNSHLALEEIFDEYLYSYDKKGLGKKNFIDTFDTFNDILWDEYRKGSITKEELRYLRFQNTLNKMEIKREEIIPVLDDEYLLRTSSKPYLVDNALLVIECLSKHYTLGIITNGFYEAQRMKLENCKLDRYFKYVCISEKVGAAKPNPSIFNYAVDVSMSQKDEIVFIGDDFDVDIKGASFAGIYPIWLNRWNNKIKSYIKYTEIHDLIELIEIF